MPNLSTFSLLNERVNKYKVDYALEKPSMAFEYLALETILGLGVDDIVDAVTDGPMDGGVDAIHIDGRDIHIFSFKYTTNFDHTKNNFPENDIDKFLVTMERIYSKSLTKSDVNDALWERVNEIWSLFEEGSLHFRYYLCSNKTQPVENARKKFEITLNKYRFVEYFYYDQEDIVTRILENKQRKVNGSISFIEKQYFERSDGPLKGIVASIAATDLIKLIQDPSNPDKINEDVFDDNVRLFLHLRNKINSDIYDTALSDTNYEFWYLNNGINIICEECIYTPNLRSPRVELKNLQIVNGGQTTHALFEAYKKNAEKLDDVLVLLKICQTRDRSISEKISETTNSQTPVMTRDLHSNDRIQKKLDEEFLTLGYYYERKRNLYAVYPKSLRLDSELLGQLYMAYYLDMASEAKNSKTLVFGSRYDEIFNEDTTTAGKMLLPYKIFLPLEQMKQEIQRKKRRREAISERDAFVSRATFHILNASKYVADKEILDLMTETGIKLDIEGSIRHISNIVEKEQEKRGELYTHDKFFKEIPTNKIIRDYILSQY